MRSWARIFYFLCESLTNVSDTHFRIRKWVCGRKSRAKARPTDDFSLPHTFIFDQKMSVRLYTRSK